MADTNSPRPYLTREEVNERLQTLGFHTGDTALNYPAGFQKPQFIALQELLAGAIAEWADVDLTGVEVEGVSLLEALTDEQSAEAWAKVQAELEEWTEEWLVG